MKPNPLPADEAARRKLEAKLAGLMVKVPAGQTGSPLAAKLSGKWYEFQENDRGIRALAIDFAAASPVLVVRTSAGETRTPIGSGWWVWSRGTFSNGLNRFLAVPMNPAVAAGGAWTAEDTFTVKLVLSETPFYSTLTLRFDGDRVVFDSEDSVAFGSTKLPQLVGVASAVK
ncbi:MAG TPA: hypothetical protein VFV34_06295 [Blastocatellia bacterium]|nr:hypothetical protein [Blastocatellia bacterium]